MTCQASKEDVGPFIALLELIKNMYDSQSEIYRVLLAVMCDYDPTVVGNRQKTCRYIRLLVTDKVLANCLITSLPKGVPEKSKQLYTSHQLSYPIKKRIKHRYCFKPKKSTTLLSSSKLIRNCHSTLIHRDNENKKGSLLESMKEPVKVDVTMATPAAVCSAADGLLALTSNCPRQLEPAQPAGNASQSAPTYLMTEPACTVAVSGLPPIAPRPQATSKAPGQTAGQHTSVSIGHPYQCHPYPYAQPMPAIPGCPDQFATASAISWGPVQFMQRFHQDQFAKMSVYGNGACNYSQSLLDLSTSTLSKSGADKTPGKGAAVNVGIVKSGKRSASTSCIEKSSRSSQPKMVKLGLDSIKGRHRQSNIIAIPGSQFRLPEKATSHSSSFMDATEVNDANRSSVISNSILALQQLNSNIGQDMTTPKTVGNIKPEVISSSHSSLMSTNVQATSTVKKKGLSASSLNNSMQQQILSSILQPSKLQSLNLIQELPALSSTNAQKSVCTTSVTGIGTQANSNTGLRSFPYSQHVQLPDGSCPIVDFSSNMYPDNQLAMNPITASASSQPAATVIETQSLVADAQSTPDMYSQGANPALGSYKATMHTTDSRQLPKEHSQLASSVYNPGEMMLGTSDEPLPRQAQARHPPSPTSLENKTDAVSTITDVSDSGLKSRQVKIRLDKHIGSKFLSELMKLKVVRNMAGCGSPSTRSVHSSKTATSKSRSASASSRATSVATTHDTAVHSNLTSPLLLTEASPPGLLEGASTGTMWQVQSGTSINEPTSMSRRQATSMSISESSRPTPNWISAYGDAINTLNQGHVPTEVCTVTNAESHSNMSIAEEQGNVNIAEPQGNGAAAEQIGIVNSIPITPAGDNTANAIDTPMIIITETDNSEEYMTTSIATESSSQSPAVVTLQNNKETLLASPVPETKGKEQSSQYNAYTLPVKSTATATSVSDQENRRMMIHDKAFLQVIKDQLLEMDSEPSIQRGRVYSDSNIQSGGSTQQITIATTGPMLHTSSSTGTVGGLTQSTVFTANSIMQPSTKDSKSTTPHKRCLSDSDYDKTLKRSTQFLAAALRPSAKGDNSSSCSEMDGSKFEYPETGSCSSSLSVSPYLLGLLPDKLEEDGADDVFMDEIITPDNVRYRPKLLSAQPTSSLSQDSNPDS